MQPNPSPDPKLKRETEQAIAQIGLALSRIRDADALEGLLAWCKACFGPHRRNKNCVTINVPWLKPLLTQTKGRLQRAAEEYKAITSALPAEEEPSFRDSGALQLIVEQAADCLTKLGDWKQAKQWIQEMDARGFVTTNEQTFTGVPLANVYVQALDAFENSQFTKAHELIAGYLRDYQWNAMPLDFADPYSCLQLSEALLLDAMATWRMLEDFSTLNKSALLSEMKGKLAAAAKLLDAPLAMLGLEGARVCYPFLVQAHCVQLVDLRTYCQN